MYDFKVATQTQKTQNVPNNMRKHIQSEKMVHGIRRLARETDVHII